MISLTLLLLPAIIIVLERERQDRSIEGVLHYDHDRQQNSVAVSFPTVSTLTREAPALPPPHYHPAGSHEHRHADSLGYSSRSSLSAFCDGLVPEESIPRFIIRAGQLREFASKPRGGCFAEQA